MRAISKKLIAFLRYCLTPEDSCSTTTWLCVCPRPEAQGALKCLFWIAALSGLAVRLF